MNTKIRLSLCVAALMVCVPIRADDVSGKVLLLTTERTLEGDIDQVGEAFRVKRQTGEMSVPAAQVLRLCATMEEAFECVRGRANLRDPDERLRLADWCNVRGLKERAVEEVAAAVELRPNHAPSKRLLEHLRRAAEPVRLTSPEPVKMVAPPEPTNSVDLTNDSMCAFHTRVQPILMNACANCHANDRGGSFKLTRATADSPLGSRAVQQNLTAVMSQINRKQPGVSPLLTKAVSAHGALAQAPIKNRQSPAYQRLEEWIHQTLAGNPQLLGPDVPTVSPTPSVPVEPPTTAEKPTTSFGETKPKEPAAPQGPLDEFDPNIFNRQMHPPRQ
jgi:hypothetical protein